MGTALRQPVAIPSGSGRQLKSLGIVHKLTRAQTNGAFYLCEAIFAPESGSPLHIHHYEDEVIHILEGAIDVRLDGQQLHAEAGGVVHLPKKVPHAFRNAQKTPLRTLIFTIPGGLEGYFDEVDTALQRGSLDRETHTKISSKYGLEWLE